MPLFYTLTSIEKQAKLAVLGRIMQNPQKNSFHYMGYPDLSIYLFIFLFAVESAWH